MLTKAQKRMARTVVKRINPHTYDYLAARQRWGKRIDEKRDGDVIHVYERSRDCDGCEASQVFTLPAHPLAIERWLDEYNDSADGPLLEFDVITKDEAAHHVPLFIDHYAEQDGY